jgi:hypothetical protein
MSDEFLSGLIARANKLMDTLYQEPGTVERITIESDKVIFCLSISKREKTLVYTHSGEFVSLDWT